MGRHKMTEEEVKSCPTLFQKGQSGNPSGRPKIPKEAKARLKDFVYTSVENLIKIASDPHDKNYYAANKEIMDRVYGKATQPMEVDNSNVTKVIIDRHDEEEKPELKVVTKEG